MSIFKRKDRKSYYGNINSRFVKLSQDRKKLLAMWAEPVADGSSGTSVMLQILSPEQ
jgi:hypothetical protein